MHGTLPALRRRTLLLLAALLLAPAAAGAQLAPLPDEFARGPKLRLTPYLGWALETDREETWLVARQDGQVVFANVDATLAGGPVAGVTLEYAFSGRWNLLVGGAFMSRDVGGFTLDTAVARALSDTTVQSFTSSKSVLAKAGISLQLYDRDPGLKVRRLGASLFVAPFYMLDMPDQVAGFEGHALFDSSNQFGVNFGATGEWPFANDRLAFQVGVEDYLTVWSDEVLSRWTEFRYGAGAAAEADPSHQWVLRAGLSFRFR